MKRINWLHALILPLATALLGALWIAPLMLWLVRSTGTDVIVVPPVLLIAMLILIGSYQARFALKIDRTRRQHTIILVGGGLIALIASLALTYLDRFPVGFFKGLLDWRESVSPEAIVLVGLALTWWRGVMAGRVDVLSDESFERTFYRGVAALAGLALLNMATHFVSANDLLLSVLAFIMIAVIGLALINIERARLRQSAFGLTWRKVYRQWATTIVSVVAVILLLGLGVTALFSPETIGRLWESLRPLVEAVSSFIVGIVTVIYTVAAFLATPILPILQWIARLVMDALMAGLTLLHNFGVVIDDQKIKQNADNFLNSPTFISLSRGAAIGLVLLAIAITAIWWLYRSRKRAAKPTDEIRDSIASRELLWAQLKQLLARLRSRQGSALPPLYLSLNGTPDDPRVIIRRAYRSMLDWARAHGYSRFPYQTPSLYAIALSEKFPFAKEPIDSLTRSYLLARYSIDPLSPEESRRAQDAIDQLHSAKIDPQ